VTPLSEEREFEELRTRISKNSKLDTRSAPTRGRFLATLFFCVQHERKSSTRSGDFSGSPGPEEVDLSSAKAPTRGSENADLHGMTFA